MKVMTRLWSLVLHDLQGLGSLTSIMCDLSDIWDISYPFISDIAKQFYISARTLTNLRDNFTNLSAL
jgi:hypothetical protein